MTTPQLVLAVGLVELVVVLAVLLALRWRVWRCERNGHAWDTVESGIRCHRCGHELKDGDYL